MGGTGRGAMRRNWRNCRTRGLFDQQVRAVNQLTGEPIAQMPYKLTTAGGDIQYGMTDEYGKTSRIATVGQEDVRVEWGVTAPSSGT